MMRRIVPKEALSLPRHRKFNNRIEQKHDCLLSRDAQVKKRPSVTSKIVIFHRQYSKQLRSIFIIIGFFSLLTILLSRQLIRISFRITSRNHSYNKPRVVQVHADLTILPSFVANKASSKREIDLGPLKPYISKDHRARAPLWHHDCEPMHWWQETSFPTCNKFHEMHMEKDLKWIAEGGYNSVFEIKDKYDNQKYVIKILGVRIGSFHFSM